MWWQLQQKLHNEKQHIYKNKHSASRGSVINCLWRLATLKLTEDLFKLFQL